LEQIMPRRNWITEALSRIEASGAVVRASLIQVKGSAPREAGAMMLIDSADIWQTIGGGTLEYEVMQKARSLIEDSRDQAAWQRRSITAALGPDMGQCCGGTVRLLLEHFSQAERQVLERLETLVVEDEQPLLLAHPMTSGPELAIAKAGPIGLAKGKDVFVAPRDLAMRPLFLYGAGHIGRVLAGHLATLELDVHWVDINPTRFPASIPEGVRRVIASDPAIIAGHAPPDAIHLVITHNHALDEAICHRVLAGGGFARLGLIGSATKKARFYSRLKKAGIAEDQLARLICPIGIPEISGKHPARVALSIAASVAIWQQELDVQTAGLVDESPSATA
jgi:xanthine dehydrogenase accessory factor